MRGLIIFGIPALAVASLALTGCDGTGPGQGPKAAATLPNPKAGLWRETFSRDGQMLGLIGDVRACLDGDARARLSALGSHTDRSMCADQSVTRDPDGGYRRLLLRNDRLVAAVLYGATEDAPWYMRLIRDAHPLGALREMLPFGPAFA